MYPFDQMGQFGQALLPQIPGMLTNPMTAAGGMFGAGATGIRNVLNQGQGGSAQTLPPPMTPGPSGFGHDAAPSFGSPGAGTPGASYQYGANAPGPGAPQIPTVPPPAPGAGGSLVAQNPVGFGVLPAASDDPKTAVILGLQKAGYNPYANTPWIKLLLQHADDIVSGVLARATQAGGAALGSTQSLQDAVNAQVAAAMSGGGTGIGQFGGSTNSLLGTIQGLLDRYQSGQGQLSPGEQVAASLFGDPNRLGNLLGSLNYGLEAPSVAATLSRPLAGLGIEQLGAEQRGQPLTAVQLLQRIPSLAFPR